MSLIKALALPNIHHKKRSALLQPKAFIGYFLFILVLIYISHQLTTAMPSVLSYAENIHISDLLSNTNKMREERGISSLKLNATLSRAAEAKAKDMFEKDYWAHTSPDGKEPWDFIIASGYDYLYAGENLAVDFNNSTSVVEAWYDSSSHRENLLNSRYTEIGFAVANGELEGRETTIVVQMFGFPRTQAASISSGVKDEESSVVVPEPIPIDAEVSENLVEAGAPEETTIETVDIDDSSLPIQRVNSAGAVLNSSDVFNVSRFLAIILGIFITALFAIDGYYIRQMGVFRISGHTILHILMLVSAIVGIWYTHIGLVL